MAERVARCVICGKEFTTSHPRQKTCGPDCRIQHNREKAKETSKDSGWMKSGKIRETLSQKVRRAMQLGVSYGRLQQSDAFEAARKAREGENK